MQYSKTTNKAKTQKRKNATQKPKQNTKNKQTNKPNKQPNNMGDGNYYQKKLQEPWFGLIQTGVKKVEGRPNKGDFAEMDVGDNVEWTNDLTGKNRRLLTKIVGIRRYNTFYDMIETEGLNNVLPATGAGIHTVKEIGRAHV